MSKKNDNRLRKARESKELNKKPVKIVEIKANNLLLKQENQESTITVSKDENDDQLTVKKKDNNRLYVIFSRIVLFLTALSSVLTGYDIVYKFIQGSGQQDLLNNSLNYTHSLVSWNGTDFSNSTISNPASSHMNYILNKINLSSMIISLIPQMIFLIFDIGKLDLKFLQNKQIKNYLQKNLKGVSNLITALPQLAMLRKQKASEKFIEENYSKYILYKLLEISQCYCQVKQIKAIGNLLAILKKEKKFIEEQKTRYIPEINVFLFRLFENSEYEIKKRKFSIVEKSIIMLELLYENFNQIEKKDIEEFIEKYQGDLKKISKYSKEKALYLSLLTQNIVFFSQSFDAIVTTYGTIGIAFHDAVTFFRNYTSIALCNGVSWMCYDLGMSKQKEYELIIKNTSRLLNLNTADDLNFLLTKVVNPSYSINSIRKEQSYFGSMNWYLLPIFAYFSSLGYSHFLDDRHYEKTTVIRSLSVLAMSTLVKRIEVFLKFYETEGNKSQLGKLSAVLVINILMPQGVLLSFVQMMKNNNINRYVILLGDLVANVGCGFMNISLNVLSQKYTAKEASSNLNNCIELFKIEEVDENKEFSALIV